MSLPPLVEPAASLSVDEVKRYSRHLIIPDVGMADAGPFGFPGRGSAGSSGFPGRAVAGCGRESSWPVWW